MTRMRPPLLCSMAGFIAGSIPTSGRSGYMMRRSFTAAEVAVLQAIASPLISYSSSSSTARNVSLLISSRGLVPYGTLAESPKYTKFSSGINFTASLRTLNPPRPESMKPIGLFLSSVIWLSVSFISEFIFFYYIIYFETNN